MSDPLAELSRNELDAARRGRTWPMLSVKQALAALPVDAAFAQFAALLDRPAGSALSARPLAGVREWAAHGASFFADIEPGGGDFVNLPPRAIGASDHRTLACRTRPLYLAAFDQVRTRGRSQLIEMPGRVLLDFDR
jgi:hypothetical protein